MYTRQRKFILRVKIKNRRVLEKWRKKNSSTETVEQKFKKVKSTGQLRHWTHTLNKGGIYREKIAGICELTLENFKSAIDAGLIFHKNDSRK